MFDADRIYLDEIQNNYEFILLNLRTSDNTFFICPEKIKDDGFFTYR